MADLIGSTSMLVDALERIAGEHPWKYGSHDCIGSMIEIVRLTTGRTIDRDRYIPPIARHSYKMAFEWSETLPDPTAPFRQALSDVGLTERNPVPESVGDFGHVVIVSGGMPLVLDDGSVYPTTRIPGALFAPGNGSVYIRSSRGLSTVPPGQVTADRRHHHFDLF